MSQFQVPKFDISNSSVLDDQQSHHPTHHRNGLLHFCLWYWCDHLQCPPRMEYFPHLHCLLSGRSGGKGVGQFRGSGFFRHAVVANGLHYAHH